MRELLAVTGQKQATTFDAVLNDALTDPVSPGVIDRAELPLVMAAWGDLHTTIRRGGRAMKVAFASLCGVGCLSERPDYFLGMVEDYVSDAEAT